MIKNEQKPWLQSDRDKMIWSDRDLAVCCTIALIVGIFFGWVL